MLLRILVISVNLLAANLLFAQASYPPEFQGSKSAVYKTVGDVELKLWMFVPDGHNPETDARPAIVFFFGGGWRAGNPGQFEDHCRYLASRGMVAVTADYRVASRHNVKAAACVEDCKSAVRWLRSKSGPLGIDPQRICAAGGSAGGHTACCTALIEGFEAAGEDLSVSSVPNALALFNPAVLIARLPDFAVTGIDDGKYDDIASRTGVEPEQISPIHHVRSGMPPTVIFHGKADSTVPYATVDEFTRRMVAVGNRCELNGFSDAPHGFFNASRHNNAELKDRGSQWRNRTWLQLDKFLKSLGWLDGEATVRVVDSDNVSVRGNFENSFQKLEVQKKGHVAFLGGSITEMDGYRPRVAAWLQQRFPQTEFTFTNAGIASTCSNTGAFRLKQDVLSQGDVDLLFVEFAVNDDQDAFHANDACVQGMEGIIRQVRMFNPNADIVMTHFVNPGMLQTLKAGNPILSATEHEGVARHYNVSSVYLSREVADRIDDGTLTWEQFGGTHPGPIGNQLAADLATSILEAGWRGLHAEQLQPTPHDLPANALLETSFVNGTLLPAERALALKGWTFSEPDWNSIAGSKRERFLKIPLLHATQPGAKFTLKFTGTAVGLYVVAGPDAGQLKYEIDDGETKTSDLFHRFSKGLHYPQTVMLARDLPAGKHTLTVTVAETHNNASKGHAARILAFAVNGLAE